MPVVYSMDDEKVYGPRVHQLTFREAVRQGIICDYEVLVSVVTNKMLGVGAIETGEVRIKGRKVPARTVAHHLALCQATSCYGVKKIFSFHPRVSEAEEFTNSGPESAAHHLPKDFRLFHVNGAMTTALREEKIAEFREAGRALMSNARCLTQGIDVPAVDMVAFLSKKRSLIDIVQATGRAMRKAPGKTKGYILVPLFVEQGHGETLEQAVERSDFREVWAVLNAMREQDEALADTMSRIRVKKGEDEGDEESPDDDNNTIIDKITVVGPEVKVQDLRRAITTICVDRLTTSWDEMYGRLLGCWKKTGNCNISCLQRKSYALSNWVAKQRALYRSGNLSQHRIDLLDQIGFKWGFHEKRTDLYSSWEEASVAVKKLEICTFEEYGLRRHEDPHLPSHPEEVYSDVWKQKGRWLGFFGKYSGEPYPLWEEASAAVRSLKIKSFQEYKVRRTEDPRLPSNPNIFYKNVWAVNGKWKGYFGIMVYPTWEEAVAAVIKLEINSEPEYKLRHDEDPRLPPVPRKPYKSVWKKNGGWAGFLGTAKK
jgi:hypothetical protein